MITLRLAVPAVLAAAIIAACFTYLVTPPSAQIEAGQLLPPTVLNSKGHEATASTSVGLHPPADEEAAAAYWKAAQAILRRTPNAQASADADEPPAKRPIPLPRRPDHRPLMLGKQLVGLGRLNYPNMLGRLARRLGHDDQSNGILRYRNKARSLIA